MYSSWLYLKRFLHGFAADENIELAGKQRLQLIRISFWIVILLIFVLCCAECLTQLGQATVLKRWKFEKN